MDLLHLRVFKINQLHTMQTTRGPRAPRPYGETNYVKDLKKRIKEREEKGLPANGH
jgi:hypothetical protein